MVKSLVLGSGGRVAFDGTAHAARSAPAAAEFGAGDGDDLDALLAEVGVGGDVALVADDDTGGEGEEVAAVVPLFALGAADVLRRGQHPDLVQVEGLGQGAGEV